MRALTYVDIDRVEMADMPVPIIEEPTDVVLRVTTTAICGSDLHVLRGRVPGVLPGTTLGHEFTGVVEEVGSAVTTVKAGDRVLASFNIPCGRCWFCQQRLFSRCPDARTVGYGMFAGDLQGAQADYVRVPNADLCLRIIDDGVSDETVLFAGDIFTTGYDCAVEGQIHEGDTVVVQGCGPVGLMAIQAARTFGPSAIYAVDTVSQRLEVAQSFGAIPVDASTVHAPSHIQDHTGGRGAEVALECVGARPALIDAIDSVRAGGRVSVIGIYSDPGMEMPLTTTFLKGIDIKFCGTANIVGRWDEALALITSGAADPASIISHRMKLDDAVRGYELFANREALKVVLTP
ncbi:MAG: alcohol dehydrogenase catalytic domain-containing protein [Candidatus Dormibacteraeota bacterium]|uniref:Alcohol dehydrogenase catalytic domain-containing protein n=1 Tax=Candidatus Aeolococcus gillhamiae TaxID=3127015 RepID=A0A934JYN8_9BACT|nr:alcohol dehydrogenase catalytic domain-containing protein [Candidatus Dormibacteraeota bacterium]